MLSIIMVKRGPLCNGLEILSIQSLAGKGFGLILVQPND
jgi:hypothetical protein